jgi:hypothetical protein
MERKSILGIRGNGAIRSVFALLVLLLAGEGVGATARASVPPEGSCNTAWTYNHKDYQLNNWYTAWMYMSGSKTSVSTQYIQYRTSTGWQGVERWVLVNNVCTHQEMKRTLIQYSTQLRSPSGGPPYSTATTWTVISGDALRYAAVSNLGPFTFTYCFCYKTRPTS